MYKLMTLYNDPFNCSYLHRIDTYIRASTIAVFEEAATRSINEGNLADLFPLED